MHPRPRGTLHAPCSPHIHGTRHFPWPKAGHARLPWPWANDGVPGHLLLHVSLTLAVEIERQPRPRSRYPTQGPPCPCTSNASLTPAVDVEPKPHPHSGYSPDMPHRLNVNVPYSICLADWHKLQIEIPPRHGRPRPPGPLHVPVLASYPWHMPFPLPYGRACPTAMALGERWGPWHLLLHVSLPLAVEIQRQPRPGSRYQTQDPPCPCTSNAHLAPVAGVKRQSHPRSGCRTQAPPSQWIWSGGLTLAEHVERQHRTGSGCRTPD
jgi:hypothetical protein